MNGLLLADPNSEGTTFIPFSEIIGFSTKDDFIEKEKKWCIIKTPKTMERFETFDTNFVEYMIEELIKREDMHYTETNDSRGVWRNDWKDFVGRDSSDVSLAD